MHVNRSNLLLLFWLLLVAGTVHCDDSEDNSTHACTEINRVFYERQGNADDSQQAPRVHVACACYTPSRNVAWITCEQQNMFPIVSLLNRLKPGTYVDRLIIGDCAMPRVGELSRDGITMYFSCRFPRSSSLIFDPATCALRLPMSSAWKRSSSRTLARRRKWYNYGATISADSQWTFSKA